MKYKLELFWVGSTARDNRRMLAERWRYLRQGRIELRRRGNYVAAACLASEIANVERTWKQLNPLFVLR